MANDRSTAPGWLASRSSPSSPSWEMPWLSARPHGRRNVDIMARAIIAQELGVPNDAFDVELIRRADNPDFG